MKYYHFVVRDVLTGTFTHDVVFVAENQAQAEGFCRSWMSNSWPGINLEYACLSPDEGMPA